MLYVCEYSTPLKWQCASQLTSISVGKLRISIASGLARRALIASNVHVPTADTIGMGLSNVIRSGAQRARTPAAAAAAGPAACADNTAAVFAVAAKPPLNNEKEQI